MNVQSADLDETELGPTALSKGGLMREELLFVDRKSSAILRCAGDHIQHIRTDRMDLDGVLAKIRAGIDPFTIDELSLVSIPRARVMGLDRFGRRYLRIRYDCGGRRSYVLCLPSAGRFCGPSPEQARALVDAVSGYVGRAYEPTQAEPLVRSELAEHPYLGLRGDDKERALGVCVGVFLVLLVCVPVGLVLGKLGLFLACGLFGLRKLFEDQEQRALQRWRGSPVAPWLEREGRTFAMPRWLERAAEGQEQRGVQGGTVGPG